MILFLTDEELLQLLDDIEHLGVVEAEAKTDFDSSERELKLIEASVIKDLSVDGKMSATAAKALVGTNEEYAARVFELRTKQKRSTTARARLEAKKTVFEAYRTHSANIRMST